MSRNKVAEARFKYGFDKDVFNAELKERYEGEEDNSLRDLERFVNTKILKEEMDKAGMGYLPGEAENFYDLLSSSDENPAGAIQARAKLEEEGVNIEKAENWFVSYQTIRKYLQSVLDIETKKNTGTTPEKSSETIEKLRRRSMNVTERELIRLQKSEFLEVGELDISVTVRATCTECGRSYRVDELIEQGRCECGGSLAE